VRRIIELFVTRRITTAMIFSGVCLLGIIAVSDLPVELLPGIDLPVITVITSYEGASPTDVEKLVTARIEEAVTSVSGARGVMSESIDGMSIVKVNFGWGVNMDMALMAVREKTDLIRGQLPENAGKPVVVRYDPADEPVMIYSVSLKNADVKNTRRRAEKEIVPFLERINGVALVELLGGEKREILVEVDNASLHSKGLSLPEIVQAVGMSNYSYPAGTIVREGKEYLVRTDGSFRNCLDIGSVVAGYGEQGVPVFLSDVAAVRDTFRERKSAVRFNGTDGVVLLVKKEASGNTIMTCSTVKSEMGKILSGRNNDLDVRLIYDQSRFIRSSVNNVILAAVTGGAISFFVIWFFLKTPCPSLIISMSIPVSFAGTMLLMKIFGISLNTMSLGGLAVGAGMMVDAGIVVLESIEDAVNSGYGISPVEAAVKGAVEVAAPVTASVLTSIIVFLPIIFLSGLSGAVFRDLALTVSFSLAFSLICSLLLIPMLSGLNIRPVLIRNMHGESIGKIIGLSDRLMNRVSSLYGILIRIVIASWKKVMAGGVAAMITGFLLFAFTGMELMPKVDTGELVAEIELPGGTPLSGTSAFCETLEKYIVSTGLAENIVVKAGCDPEDSISEKISGRGTDYAVIRIFMKKGSSSGKLMDALHKNIKAGERARVTFRVKDDIVSSVFSSGGSKTGIEVYADDGDGLKDAGRIIRENLLKMNWVTGAASLFEHRKPELRVDIDRETASSLGLNIEDAAAQIAMAVRGEVSSMFRDGDDEVEIRVKLLKNDTTGTDALDRIIVKTGTGVTVPLSKFAVIKAGSGCGRIVRKEQSRINVVTADIASGAGIISDRLKKLLESLKFREGVQYKIADGSEEIKESAASLCFAMILAVVFIYMLLAAQFQSLKNPLIIMLSIPVTALGVSSALILTGQTLNINTGIGMILLCGTVVNNAIVLFDCIEKECAAGRAVKDAVMLAGRRRLRPILMTTLTTVLALVPVALGMGEGAELQRPLAVTVIGGMAVSTVLTLVFIPAVYAGMNSMKHGRVL